MGRLTAKSVEALSKAKTPSRICDGNGLYFQISKAGGTSWLYRFQIEGRSREMGLGPYPETSLAEAREKASDARKLSANGVDPLTYRNAEREARREAQRLLDAQHITFTQLTNDYCHAHGANWSEKWRKGWLRKMELYAYPHIGELPAREINTEQVLQVLQPIWGSKTRTADEVRGQIEKILDAGKARQLRDGDNPARWRGHLDNLLGKTEKRIARKREHFAAMPWKDVPALFARLEKESSIASVAARLLILTGARLSMVRYAMWTEFDLNTGIWSLPPERMKMRQAFRIPLAPEVVQLLSNLPRIESSPYLFTGSGRSGVMHGNFIRQLLHGLGHAEITSHGFRSSFRDWANEQTHCPREVCELALAHDQRDQTESAYSRSDLLEKRRALMGEWARYVATPPAANVIHAGFRARTP